MNTRANIGILVPFITIFIIIIIIIIIVIIITYVLATWPIWK